jgi:hypothetical protein
MVRVGEYADTQEIAADAEANSDCCDRREGVKHAWLDLVLMRREFHPMRHRRDEPQCATPGSDHHPSNPSR